MRNQESREVPLYEVDRLEEAFFEEEFPGIGGCGITRVISRITTRMAHMIKASWCPQMVSFLNQEIAESGELLNLNTSGPLNRFASVCRSDQTVPSFREVHELIVTGPPNWERRFLQAPRRAAEQASSPFGGSNTQQTGFGKSGGFGQFGNSSASAPFGGSNTQHTWFGQSGGLGQSGNPSGDAFGRNFDSGADSFDGGFGNPGGFSGSTPASGSDSSFGSKPFEFLDKRPCGAASFGCAGPQPSSSGLTFNLEDSFRSVAIDQPQQKWIDFFEAQCDELLKLYYDRVTIWCAKELKLRDPEVLKFLLSKLHAYCAKLKVDAAQGFRGIAHLSAARNPRVQDCVVEVAFAFIVDHIIFPLTRICDATFQAEMHHWVSIRESVLERRIEVSSKILQLIDKIRSDEWNIQSK